MPAIRNASRYSRVTARLLSSGIAFGATQRTARATARTHRTAMRMDGVMPRASALSLFYAGRFAADSILQIEQLCAAHEATAHDFDLLDARRVDEKRAFDAHAMRDAPNGEALRKTAMLAFDDHAFEHLNALFVAFSNPR